jgi:hypothetical protein
MVGVDEDDHDLSCLDDPSRSISSLARRLQGVAHIRLDGVGSFSFQRVGVEVERSVRQHDGVVTTLAKNLQGFTRTVLTEIAVNPRVPTGITGGGG